MSRLEELYERQCDGTLSSEEQAEFATLLADGENQRDLTRLMSLHGAIAQAGSTARVLSSRRSLWFTARWQMVASAALLIIGVGLGITFAFHAHGQAGDIWQIAESGHDTTVTQDQTDQPASPGSVLSHGHRLHGQATLTLADGTRVEAGPDAQIETLSDRPGIRLVAGRVAIAAHPRPHGPPLVVDTQYGAAEVRGTHYSVAADSLRVVVSVLDGTVAFLHGTDAPLLVTGGMGVCATALARTRFDLPASSYDVDFSAAGLPWTGEPVAGGRRPVFHHKDPEVDQRQVFGLASPQATGSGYVALGAGLDLTLRYDLPQASNAFVILVIASAADPHDFRVNLQADLQLPAGTGQTLHIPAARFSIRTGDGPLDRGDEVVATVFVMLMDSDHQAVFKGLSLTPAPH